MAEFLGLEARIETTGAAEASAAIKGVGTSAKEAAGGVGTLDAATSGFKEAIASLGVAFGLSEFVGLLKESVSAAADAEFALLKLSVATTNAGGSAKDLAFSEKLIASEHAQIAFSTRDITAALADLTLKTGNVTAGQALLDTALQVSYYSGKSLETVTRALSAAWEGHAGLLSRLTGIYGDADTVLATVQARYKDLAQKDLTSLHGQLALIARDWQDQKDGIGGVVSTLPAFRDLMQEIHTAILGVTDAIARNRPELNALIGAVQGLLMLLKGAGAIIEGVWRGALVTLKLFELGLYTTVQHLAQVIHFLSDKGWLPSSWMHGATAVLTEMGAAALRLRNDIEELRREPGSDSRAAASGRPSFGGKFTERVDIVAPPKLPPSKHEIDADNANILAAIGGIDQGVLGAPSEDITGMGKEQQRAIDYAEGLLKIGREQVSTGKAVAEGQTNQQIALKQLNELVNAGRLSWSQYNEIIKSTATASQSAAEKMAQWAAPLITLKQMGAATSGELAQLDAYVRQLDKSIAASTDTAERAQLVTQRNAALGISGRRGMDPLTVLKEHYAEAYANAKKGLVIDLPRVIDEGFQRIGESLGRGVAVLVKTGNVGQAFKAIGQSLLGGFGDMVTSQGKALMAYGVTMLKLTPFLTNIFTSGPAALAAGLALVALGSAFSAAGSGQGGGGGSGAGGSGGGTTGWLTPQGVSGTTYLTPATGQPFAAGTPYPGQQQPLIVNVVGYDNPAVVRGIAQAVNSAKSRGIL